MYRRHKLLLHIYKYDVCLNLRKLVISTTLLLKLTDSL
jgi:hypothetical protein